MHLQGEAERKLSGRMALGSRAFLWLTVLVTAGVLAVLAYTPDWAERNNGETLLAAAGRHLVATTRDAMAPGDVLLFRMHAGAPIKHCAILDEDAHILHAYWGRAVVRSRFAPWWRALASRSSDRSTATIRSAPASRHPITAPRPTRPHPNTTHVAPGRTSAV